MGHMETTATWSEFLADPEAHAARLKETGGYEVLTVDGRREYALISAELLDYLTSGSEEFDQQSYEAALREGLADAATGRTRALKEIEAEWSNKRGV